MLLGIVWSGIALRIRFPYDLHGGYPLALNVLNWAVDIFLLMPPWFLLQPFIATPEAPWLFWTGSMAYVVGLSLLICVLFIRKR